MQDIVFPAIGKGINFEAGKASRPISDGVLFPFFPIFALEFLKGSDLPDLIMCGCFLKEGICYEKFISSCEVFRLFRMLNIQNLTKQ